TPMGEVSRWNQSHRDQRPLLRPWKEKPRTGGGAKCREATDETHSTPAFLDTLVSCSRLSHRITKQRGNSCWIELRGGCRRRAADRRNRDRCLAMMSPLRARSRHTTKQGNRGKLDYRNASGGPSKTIDPIAWDLSRSRVHIRRNRSPDRKGGTHDRVRN